MLSSFDEGVIIGWVLFLASPAIALLLLMLYKHFVPEKHQKLRRIGG